MPSTTTDIDGSLAAGPVSPGRAPSPQGPPGPRPGGSPTTIADAGPARAARAEGPGADMMAGDPIQAGLRTLVDFVRGVGIPSRPEDEDSALEALSVLHRRQRLQGSAAAKAEVLTRYMELATEEQVESVVRWIGSKPRLLDALRGQGKRKRRRCILLFVLLAKAVTPDERFGVLLSLNRLGYFGDEHKLDRLLESIRVRIPRRRSVRLAAHYLDTAGEVLFDDGGLIRGPAEVGSDVFTSWPWPRQLLHLVVWRSTVPRAGAPGQTNPVCGAGGIEFLLARLGAYSRLSRSGGALSRHVLHRLGYADHAPLATGSPLRRFWVTGALGLALAASLLWAGSVARRWDRSQLGLANAVLRSPRYGFPTVDADPSRAPAVREEPGPATLSKPPPPAVSALNPPTSREE